MKLLIRINTWLLFILIFLELNIVVCPDTDQTNVSNLNNLTTENKSAKPATPKTTPTPVAQEAKDSTPTQSSSIPVSTPSAPKAASTPSAQRSGGSSTPSTPANQNGGSTPAKPKAGTPSSGSSQAKPAASTPSVTVPSTKAEDAKQATPATPATPAQGGSSGTDQSGGGGTPTTPDGSTPATPAKVEHPSKLKIYTEGSAQPNDETKYTLKQYDKMYKFEFNEGVKCTKIMKEDKVIWELEVTTKQNVKEVYYNSFTNLNYFSFYKTKFIYSYGDDWKFESGTTNKNLSDSKFKIVTQGNDGSTKENDSNHYDEKNDGFFVKCELKSGAKCTEVKYDTQQVYKHDANQNSVKHPKCLYFHKHMRMIFAEFEGGAFVYYRFYDKKWESENLDKMENLDVNKFKVLSTKAEGSKEFKENDTSKYDKQVIGSLVGFTIKESAKCFRFQYDSDVVVSHNRYHDKQPALKGVYFLLNTKKIIYWLEDKCFYFQKDDANQVN